MDYISGRINMIYVIFHHFSTPGRETITVFYTTNFVSFILVSTRLNEHEAFK